MDFTMEKIRVFLNELKKNITVKKTELDGFLYKYCDYKSEKELPCVDESWKVFEKNQLWGGEKNTHFWFYKKFKTNRETVFRLNTGLYGEGWGAGNPQFLVYLNGKMVYGMDYFHETIEIDKDTEYEMYIYAYTNDAVKPLEFWAYIDEIDVYVKKLYYDLSVPFGICEYLEENDKLYTDIIKHLKTAINMIDMRTAPSKEFSDSVAAASEYFDKKFYLDFCRKEDYAVIGIGHSHIDIAWLWTVKQTREKVQRTFSSVVSMMGRYPEYKFMASTPQLYEFVKEDAPELYREIKQYIKEGRWEPEGAMWVEADCNLSGGESLVRQILFGKRFFKQEFNRDSKILWLPDVFGYSAALPQILLKSGIDVFVTSKINWNEANQMPHDTFMWQGIDGSRILSYFLTPQDKVKGKKPERYTTYTGLITPKMVAGTWDRYQDKNLNDEALLTFGYGDGGGGPTEWMLENGKRLAKGISGCPMFRIDTVTAFFEHLKENINKSKSIPEWVGELYLEFHRGTYTSMAKNKRNNRKCEFMYHNAELISAVNAVLLNCTYPQEAINRGWKGILLNQFHDIIPGSSIKDVYDESDLLYQKIIKNGSMIINQGYESIAEQICTDGGILVFNNTPFCASGCAEYDGKTIYAENIPANGYKVIVPKEDNIALAVGKNKLENQFFIIGLTNGNITRIYDKLNCREIIKNGEYANELLAFEDYPKDWDAWEISNYYEEKMWRVDNVIEQSLVDYGEKAGIKIKRKFLNSTIIQEICIFKNMPRIDFDTVIEWNESHILLKAAFPIDVHADKATYDIQFGNVERPTHRNTSWEEAKFEVCAHKFADVSEDDYGVSLMNDCKYGYDIHGSTMRLTLLKSATYPNPEADKGMHRFVYSLYPHSGRCSESDVIKQAYLLNNPLKAIRVDKNNGILPDKYSFVYADCANVVIETVKKAEDSRKFIIRMYEYGNKRTKAKISFGFDVNDVSLCDMMENEIESLVIDNNSTICKFKPFEIITLAVEKKEGLLDEILL